MEDLTTKAIEVIDAARWIAASKSISLADALTALSIAAQQKTCNCKAAATIKKAA